MKAIIQTLLSLFILGFWVVVCGFIAYLEYIYGVKPEYVLFPNLIAGVILGLSACFTILKIWDQI